MKASHPLVRLRFLPVALFLGVTLLGACSDKKRPEILVGFVTDLTAPGELTSVKAEVYRVPEQTPRFEKVWEISGATGKPYELPGSLGVVSEGADDSSVKVVVRAFRGPADTGRELMSRSAIVPFASDDTLFMRMALVWVCVDNADCPADKTCIEGRCRTPQVDPRLLPVYAPGMEARIACVSGPAYLNTGTRQPLVAERTCAADEFCLEGTCYKRPAGLQAQSWEIVGTVTGPDGKPMPGVRVWVSDANTNLAGRTPGAPEPPGSVTTDDKGAFTAKLTLDTPADPVKTLIVTAAAAGGVPQVAAVPVKEGVGRYFVLMTLFPLKEQPLPSGPSAGSIKLEERGLTATVLVPPNSTKDLRLRYALLDPYALPARLAPTGSTGEVLQAAGVFYLDLVDAAAAPQPLVPVAVQLTSYPFRTVTGAQTIQAARLDAQGFWAPSDKAVMPDPQGPIFEANRSGFWTLGRAFSPACVRGKVVRRGGGACVGTRVRTAGPVGLSAFDATGMDGTFCAAAAPGRTTTLFVGSLRQTVYPPAQPGVCGMPSTCADAGEIELPAEQCDAPTLRQPGTAALGTACIDSNECEPAATCYRSYCVTDGELRVSLNWTAKSDFDLHVVGPGGTEISVNVPESKDGRLDVHQCRATCDAGPHVENAVFEAAPKGTYRAWVENEDGQGTGMFLVEILERGKVVQELRGMLPAQKGAKSESVTYELK